MPTNYFAGFRSLRARDSSLSAHRLLYRVLAWRMWQIVGGHPIVALHGPEAVTSSAASGTIILIHCKRWNWQARQIPSTVAPGTSGIQNRPASVLIHATDWITQTKAASKLGINRNTLHKKIDDYGLHGEAR